MYGVSAAWTEIQADPNSRYQFSVVIGESGRLIDNAGNTITFGGDRILIGQADAGSGYGESRVISLTTQHAVFPGRQPAVGACISAELDLQIIRPAGEIPRMALVRPYVRVVNDSRVSEWIPQGIFYIDTRRTTQNDDGLNILTLHAYDAMLMTEQLYPSTTHAWPATDTAVVQEIANTLGVGVDPRTWDVMTQAYPIPAPVGYTMRETLANIGAMYAGNWIMNYDGDLLLIPLDAIPPETNYLIDETGAVILIGGDRILV